MSPYKPENANFRNFGASSPWYSICTKAIFISKGSFRDVERKNIILRLAQKGYKPQLGFKIPAFMHRHKGSTMQISEILRLPITWYRVCTKEIFTSKGSFRDADSKNIILVSVQKGYKPLHCFKLSAFMYRHIGPTMQSSEISGLPIAMVPCLHRTNIHIKRKL